MNEWKRLALARGCVAFAISSDPKARELPADGTGALPAAAARAAVGRFGPGPLSGLPWFSGSWVNGGPDRLADFEKYRGRKSDCVEQGMPGMKYWHENAGCKSEADVDAEMAQSPAEFKPSLNGVFRSADWKSHIWGEYPAPEHRKRLIHLGWMNAIPSAVGNGDGKNPRLWADVAAGSGDKYMFLLGRKFAYLDAQYGDAAFPPTIDLCYEWTLTSHPCWPGGAYEAEGQIKETYKDFPYGWSRLARVFREGYAYQRGKPCEYRFCWRPQLRFSVTDAAGAVVRHERMWPNDVADWTIPEDVAIGGVVVLPKGPIGAQANLLAVSWHDSSFEYVKGGSLDDPGGNWQKILDGSLQYWGFADALNFARQKNVWFCLPEWGAFRQDPKRPRVSPFPGDVYRFTHWLIEGNLDVLAYECVFDQGSGDLKKPWIPPQPPEQDPVIVYRTLWNP